MKPRILLLGGTAEALITAHALVRHYDLIYSLAGATTHPKTPSDAKVRIGGFGGVAGLRHFCGVEHIDLIVDCTHPFAAKMSHNALYSGVPVFRLERPKWHRMRGDRWVSVPHLTAAAWRLRHHAGPIALALGSGGQKLAHKLGKRAYLRSWTFGLNLDDPLAEADWLHRTKAKILVCKNSGGMAIGKLVAARRMGLPVMMIERPLLMGGEVFDDTGMLVRTIRHRY